MKGMKLSVSLPEEDVEYLDQYVEENSAASRSAAVHEAIRLLRRAKLEQEYAEAYDEWDGSEDQALWDSVSGMGIEA
jgi:Arc/MetJ-type ribon-helix-helix transcriptional regulator